MRPTRMDLPAVPLPDKAKPEEAKQCLIGDFRRDLTGYDWVCFGFPLLRLDLVNVRVKPNLFEGYGYVEIVTLSKRPTCCRLPDSDVLGFAVCARTRVDDVDAVLRLEEQ